MFKPPDAPFATSGGLNIKVLSFNAESKDNAKNETTQRISFSIPLIYPAVNVNEKLKLPTRGDGFI